LAALALASSVICPAARAQDPAQAITSPPITRDEVGTIHLISGGARGAFVGVGAGSVIGLGAGAIGCRGSERSWCTLTYTLGGALAGGVIGTPIGVHTANESRGNLAATTIGSIAATVALLTVGSTLTHGNGAPLVLTIPLEIGTAIPIERYFERRSGRTEP
jgi:outer membrane lipoprotein SlyB